MRCLQFTAKQLQRLSVKCTKEEAAEKTKLKKALQKGDREGAQIYAQNAIRKKNEALNYLRMSSRIDAVASKVQTAVTMKQVTKSMDGVVKQMDKAMASMNLEQIQGVMDRFEEQFENMDVQTAAMEGAMMSTTATTTPADEVESLIQQVAEANGATYSSFTILFSRDFVWWRPCLRLLSIALRVSKLRRPRFPFFFFL